MMGAHSDERHRLPEIRIAKCRSCKQEAEGITTFESMVYSGYPIGREIHYCYACDEALMLSERPLEAVLAEYFEPD